MLFLLNTIESKELLTYKIFIKLMWSYKYFYLYIEQNNIVLEKNIKIIIKACQVTVFAARNKKYIFKK